MRLLRAIICALAALAVLPAKAVAVPNVHYETNVDAWLSDANSFIHGTNSNASVAGAFPANFPSNYSASINALTSPGISIISSLYGYNAGAAASGALFFYLEISGPEQIAIGVPFTLQYAYRGAGTFRAYARTGAVTGGSELVGPSGNQFWQDLPAVRLLPCPMDPVFDPNCPGAVDETTTFNRSLISNRLYKFTLGIASNLGDETVASMVTYGGLYLGLDNLPAGYTVTLSDGVLNTPLVANPVPEPAQGLLLALGLGVLVIGMRRR